MTRMHADEFDPDLELVRRLIATQFSEWSALPLAEVHPRGTDNALFRLGDGMLVRMPRRERTAQTLHKERQWLPRLAPALPLRLPEPIASGIPGDGYPFEWAVYTWLEGEPATAVKIPDAAQAAADLAEFLAALQRVDADGGPAPGEHNFFRGAPLELRDEPMRRAISSLDSAIQGAVTTTWETALAANEWAKSPVWIHGDLDARNVLATGGRISGVIDWGGAAVGDPACDVMVAWKMLPASAHPFFRDLLSVDDATWVRARGWVVSQAAIALAYYTDQNNPTLVAEARRWLSAATAK